MEEDKIVVIGNIFGAPGALTFLPAKNGDLQWAFCRYKEELLRFEMSKSLWKHPVISIRDTGGRPKFTRCNQIEIHLVMMITDAMQWTLDLKGDEHNKPTVYAHIQGRQANE